MLRSKPTRIALTEDDLCYHIDRIFQRNCDLAKWHQQRQSSGADYDGDNDEDDPYIHSDDCPTADSLFESECDEPQSQSLPGDSQQDAQAGDRRTGAINASRPHHRRSVRFASPEPESESELEPLSADSHSQAVIRRGRMPIVHPQPRVAPEMELAILSDTDWTGVSGDFGVQHNYRNSYSPSQPTPEHSRATGFAFDTGLASLLSSVTILPVRLLIAQPESPHLSSLLSRSSSYTRSSLNPGSNPSTAPVDALSSQLAEQQLIPWNANPSTKMARTRRTASAFERKAPQSAESTQTAVSEGEAEEALAERVPNPGTDPVQISASEDLEHHPSKEPLSTPTKVIRDGVQDKDKDAGHLPHPNTTSRATQTDSDLISPFRQHITGELTDNRSQNNLTRQENIAPRGIGAQPSTDWPRQDPFISAMFPEPGAAEYDASSQMRRGMEGFVNRPASRGRDARTEHGAFGQFVHPTLVDAAVFQEYVQRLINEIERAP